MRASSQPQKLLPTDLLRAVRLKLSPLPLYFSSVNRHQIWSKASDRQENLLPIPSMPPLNSISHTSSDQPPLFKHEMRVLAASKEPSVHLVRACELQLST
jgi:hypothetical protein